MRTNPWKLDKLLVNIWNFEDYDQLSPDFAEIIGAGEAFLKNMKPSFFVCKTDFSISWQHIWLDIKDECKTWETADNIFSSLWIWQEDSTKAKTYIRWTKLSAPEYPLIIKSDNDWIKYSINATYRPDQKLQFTLKRVSEISNYQEIDSKHAEMILEFNSDIRKLLNEAIKSINLQINPKTNSVFTRDEKRENQTNLCNLFIKFYNSIKWIKESNYEPLEIQSWYGDFKSDSMELAGLKERMDEWKSIALWTQGIWKDLKTQTINMLKFFYYAVPKFVFSPNQESVYVLSWNNPWKYTSFDHFFSSQFWQINWQLREECNKLEEIVNNPDIELTLLAIWKELLSIASIANVTIEGWWFQATITKHLRDRVQNQLLRWNTVNAKMEAFIKDEISEDLIEWKNYGQIHAILWELISKYRRFVQDLEKIAYNNK